MAERGIDGLAAARLWATDRFPYLATGLFGAEVVAAPDSGTVSVDQNWRMHADPDLVAGWTAAQLGSVLVHHVCHLLRTHGERAQAVGVRPEDAQLWVRAADASRLDRVKVKDPSFVNWRPLTFALLKNIVPDFPLCNKSFNLSYSGNDL